MAKMRAAIRKVAQVTPPPSPKNGDDIKSEWSNRLRNHSTPIANKRFKGKRAKVVRTKKRSPTFNHVDFNGSRSSTPSPICENTRPRTRQTSGDNQSHCWPRRSARLVGIPAEVDDDQFNKSNGSIKSEEESESANETRSPRRRRTSEVNGGHHPAADSKDDDQCKNCNNKRKTKARAIDALLKESEHFMHYPARRTNGCHAARQACNSHDVRPLHETSPSPEPTPVLPASVDQVQFSFEIVPSGTSWYQTFLRDERSSPTPEEPHPVAPFLLPYEMTLEAILKSNRPATGSGKPKGRPPKGSKKAANPSFRPIISTRLQMQSAAKLAAEEAAASKATDSESSDAKRDDGKRRKDRKRWFMPRKSPRCHASTMAILCSKSTDTMEPVPEEPVAATSLEDGSQADKDDEATQDGPCKLPDGDLIQALQDMLISDLQNKDRKPGVCRKRGRPRKKHRSVSKAKVERRQPDCSLVELLATPLERMEDMVDERLLLTDALPASDDDDDDPMLEWVKEGSPELPEVFHDLESNSGSRSSSVYETASEIGSTSTGTCESSHHHRNRKAWKANRRKRRNMTGWPRSKKRKPVPLSIDLGDENLCMTSDEGPPSLSPIREEPNTTDDGLSEVEDQPPPPPPLQPSPSRSSYVSKPFQFQRKTLRFVGKRILRPAAQRHAPQRLEYWPCFTVTSSSPPRPRPLPRKRRCK